MSQISGDRQHHGASGVTVPRAWMFVGALAAAFTFPFGYGVGLTFGMWWGVLYTLIVSFLCTWVTIQRSRSR